MENKLFIIDSPVLFWILNEYYLYLFVSERIYEAGSARAEEEARFGDQAAPEELEAEGNAHQEAVQGHLQDPDPAVQGSKGAGNKSAYFPIL